MDEDGVTPKLCIASAMGLSDAVRALIRMKGDVNCVMEGGASSLYIAAQEGEVKVVHTLIELSADVNLAADGNITPLWAAAQAGHVSCVQCLIDNDADVDTTENQEGTTASFIACEMGNNDVLHHLAQSKANVFEPKKDGTTPLFIAAQNGYADVIHNLILLKAEPNQPGNEIGAPPVFIAQDQSALRALLTRRADPNFIMNGGVSPLYNAVVQGWTDCVEDLIYAGANIGEKTEQDGAGFLHIAVQARQTAVMDVFLKAVSCSGS